MTEVYAYKIRDNEGKLLTKQFWPGRTGHTWSQRAHLKSALRHYNRKERGFEEGWTVLEFSVSGVRELTMEQFYAL